MSIGNIIIGLILIAIGIWFVIKAFWFNHQVFFLGWAEQKWGAGAGTMAYRWIGLSLSILGMFCVIGVVDIYGAAFGKNPPSNMTSNQLTKPKTNARNGEIAF